MKVVLQVLAPALMSVIVAACTGIGSLEAGSSPPDSPVLTVMPTSTITLTKPPTPVPASALRSTATPTPSSQIIGSGCPAPTVQVLGGWTAAWPRHLLADCYGTQDLEVSGYLAPSWGIGGPGNGVVPAWLGEWSGLPSVLWIRPHPAEGCPAADDCVWTFLFAPDATALPLSPDRWVSLTGHFNDPAALTCRATGSGDDAVTSDAVAVEQCREHFVVTQIQTLTAPGS